MSIYSKEYKDMIYHHTSTYTPDDQEVEEDLVNPVEVCDAVNCARHFDDFISALIVLEIKFRAGKANADEIAVCEGLRELVVDKLKRHYIDSYRELLNAKEKTPNSDGSQE